MDMFVRREFALQFGGGVVAVVAARTGGRVVDKAVGQDLLDAVALDFSGRESVAFDHGRGLAQHGLHLLCGDLLAVEDAELTVLPGRGAADTMTEIILAAGIELHVGGQHAAILVEKSDQAAVMIDMAVADDQRIDLRRIHIQKADVVDDRG